MIVYRIANENGNGPYISDYLSDYVNEKLDDMRWAHNDATHPSPWGDFPRTGIHSWQLCAFSSQEQLLDWFAGFEELLDELGFFVWEIEIPEHFVVELRYQTLIHRDHTTAVDRYTLV